MVIYISADVLHIAADVLPICGAVEQEGQFYRIYRDRKTRSFNWMGALSSEEVTCEEPENKSLNLVTALM